MQKNKKIVSALAIAVLLLSNVLVSGVNAASMTDASDKLSDSDINAVATHEITFTTSTTTPQTGYFEVVLPEPFGDITGEVTCSGDTSASIPDASSTVRCTANGDLAAGQYTITIGGIANPGTTGSQTINLASYDDGAALLESAQMVVAIVNSVDMSASVPSNLTFEIRPLGTSTDINGVTTTGGSATTSIAFGALEAGTSSIIGQQVSVTTNAASGYSVTVEQDGNLTSAGNADIDSFNNGTTTALLSPADDWVDPSGWIDAEWTYGHFGLTSDDDVLDLTSFGANKWRGFNGTSSIEVLYHNGPADGSTPGKGLANVAYRVQISALQEAGDYTNALTYIATPSY